MVKQETKDSVFDPVRISIYISACGFKVQANLSSTFCLLFTKGLMTKKMQRNRQFERSGSEQSSSSSDDELIRASALRKVEKEVLELMVIRAVETVVLPKIEDLIRRVVKEEIESAQDKFSARMNKNSANEMCASESRSLQLQFLNKISDLVFTGNKIIGENCDSIQLALVDNHTGKVISSGPEASAKVEIVVLHGDSDGDEEHDWTPEEFSNKIVREKSFLSGNELVKLNAGIGLVDDIKFKHAARWTNKCKLRLGARLMNTFEGPTIKEAKTEPFTLMDRRNGNSRTHHPLSLSDDVCKLKYIHKGYTVHERLSGANIKTVKDFLIMLSVDPERLQHLLGGGPNWDETISYAQTCIIDESMYLYFHSGSQHNIGIVFNCVGQLLGQFSQCQYVCVDELSESEKTDMQKLLPSAFEWKDNLVKVRDNVLCFSNEASFLQYFSQQPLTICDLSRLARLEDCSNHTQPSTFLQGASSCSDLEGVPGQVYDFDFVNDLLVQGQDNNDLIFNMEFTTVGVDDSQDLNDNSICHPEHPSINLHPHQQSPTSSFFVLCEGNGLAQKRWTWVGIVLRSVRWYVRRRIAAMEGIQVSKKQRLC